MKAWLEIQRRDGIDKRPIKAAKGSAVGVAAGECPGCGVTPFHVQGGGCVRQPDSYQADGRSLYRANGRSVCCGDAVGYIFAVADTLFGLEEDERVLEGGLCRVY
jgi:hypothetical protein